MDSNHRHITPEQYDKYLKGELSAKETRDVEATLQSASLYEEAMEGFETIASGELLDDLKELKQKVILDEPSRRINSPWLRIAALVTLLIVAVPVLWYLIDQQSPDIEPKMSQQSPIENSSPPDEGSEKTNDPITVTIDTDVVANTGSGQETLAMAKDKAASLASGSTAPSNKLNRDRSFENSLAQKPKPIETEPNPAPVIIVEEAEESIVAEELAVDFDIESTADDFIEDVVIVENEKLAETTRKQDKKLKREKLFEKKEKRIAVETNDEVIDAASARRDFAINPSLLADSQQQFKNGYLDLVDSPFPVGGYDAYERYLKSNGVFLKKKKRAHEVTLSYLVNPDSTVSEIKIISGELNSGHQIKVLLINGAKWVPSSFQQNNRIVKKFWKKIEKN